MLMITRQRAGSTFLAILAAITILLTLAAVLAPGLIGVVDAERAARTATTLTTYERALGNFDADIGGYPRALAQLTIPIGNSDRNSCSDNYSSGEMDSWDGPYLTRVIPDHARIPVDLGVIRDTLIRVPASGGTSSPGTLIIRVDSVAEGEVGALDRRVDGTVASGSGKVRWGAASGGLVAVDYRISVVGC